MPLVASVALSDHVDNAFESSVGARVVVLRRTLDVAKVAEHASRESKARALHLTWICVASSARKRQHFESASAISLAPFPMYSKSDLASPDTLGDRVVSYQGPERAGKRTILGEHPEPTMRAGTWASSASSSLCVLGPGSSARESVTLARKGVDLVMWLMTLHAHVPLRLACLAAASPSCGCPRKAPPRASRLGIPDPVGAAPSRNAKRSGSGQVQVSQHFQLSYHVIALYHLRTPDPCHNSCASFDRFGGVLWCRSCSSLCDS